MPDQQDIMLLYSITDRGKGPLLLEELKKRGIRNHFICLGIGTATSDMMDIIGLGTSDKDLIFSFGLRVQAERFVEEVAGSIDQIGRGRGIIMLIPLNSISKLTATILQKQAGGITMDRDTLSAESKSRRSLILIAVNAGYTDDVMQAARKAGATGGTLIKGRLTGVEELALEFGVELEQERELITILASEEHRDDILNTVNSSFGLRSKAQGIVCSIPVEKAFKI
ncbi:MAG: hypothetical protein J5589_13255 [Firmicutes bacterium]|nr:hypothetical protein [Bacillota bacterium]